MSANFNIAFLRTIKSGWFHQSNEFKNYINNNIDRGHYNDLDLQSYLDKLIAPLKIVGMNWLISFYGDVDILIKRKLTRESLVLLLSILKNTELYIEEILSGKLNYSIDVMFDWIKVRKEIKKSVEIENFFENIYKIPDNIKFENLKKEDLDKFIKKIVANYQNGVAKLINGDKSGIDVCILAIQDLHSLNYKKGFYPVWIAILGFLGMLKVVPNFKDYINLVQEMSLDIRRFAETKPSDKSIKKYLQIFLKNDYQAHLNDEVVKNTVNFFSLNQFKSFYSKALNGEKPRFNKHEVLNVLNEMLAFLPEVQKGEGHKRFNELNIKLKDNKDIFIGEAKNLVDAILQASLNISVSKVDDDSFEELYAAINIAIYYLDQGEEPEVLEACKIEAEKLSYVLSGEKEKAESLVLPKLKNKNNTGFIVIDNILFSFEKIALEIDEIRKSNMVIDYDGLMDSLGKNSSPLKFLNLKKAEEVLYKVVNEILFSLREKDEIYSWDDLIMCISALNLYLKEYKNGNKDDAILYKVLKQDLQEDPQINLDLLKTIEIPEQQVMDVLENKENKEDNVGSQEQEEQEKEEVLEVHEENVSSIPQQDDEDSLINKLLNEVNGSSDKNSETVAIEKEEVPHQLEAVEEMESVEEIKEKEPQAQDSKNIDDSQKVDELLSFLPKPETIYEEEQAQAVHQEVKEVKIGTTEKIENAQNPEEEFSVDVKRVLKEFCNDSDLELATIYFEEGIEKLNEIQNELMNYDDSKLPVVRRAFHTLKGSGRMAGFKVLGEAAMHAEYFLNWVKDSNYSLNEHSIKYLLSLSAKFRDWFSDLIEKKETEIDMSFLLHLEHLKTEYHQTNFENEEIPRPIYGTTSQTHSKEEYQVSKESEMEIANKFEKVHQHNQERQERDDVVNNNYLDAEEQNKLIMQASAEENETLQSHFEPGYKQHERIHEKTQDELVGALQEDEEEVLWDEAMTAIQIISQQFGVLAKTLNKLMNK